MPWVQLLHMPTLNVVTRTPFCEPHLGTSHRSGVSSTQRWRKVSTQGSPGQQAQEMPRSYLPAICSLISFATQGGVLGILAFR